MNFPSTFPTQEFIDKVFVITLDSAHDRQERFKKNFSNWETFEWFKASRHPTNSHQGCFESHQKCVEIAKKRSYKYIVILEDDAQLMPQVTWSQVEKSIEDFIKMDPSGWKYFMLGYLPIKTTKTDMPNVLDVNCAYNGQAYLVNVDNVEILKYENELDATLFCNNIHYLDLIKHVKLPEKTNVYASYPMLIRQEALESSNAELHLAQNHFFNYLNGENQASKISQNMNTIHFGSMGIVLIVLLFVLLTMVAFTRNLLFYKIWVFILFFVLFFYLVLFCIEKY